MGSSLLGGNTDQDLGINEDTYSPAYPIITSANNAQLALRGNLRGADSFQPFVDPDVPRSTSTFPSSSVKFFCLWDILGQVIYQDHPSSRVKWADGKVLPLVDLFTSIHLLLSAKVDFRDQRTWASQIP